MMTSPIYPSRAHRRFLGLTLPPQLIPDNEELPFPSSFSMTRAVRKSIQERLTTAGKMRGGILLGYQDEKRYYITALLPNSYSLTSADPYQPDPQYVLGAVDSAQQLSERPIDWIGSWVMPASGRLSREWIATLWQQAREHALLPLRVILLTFGAGEQHLEFHAIQDIGEQMYEELTFDKGYGE